jgi:CheY-like chemotaxis protein
VIEGFAELASEQLGEDNPARSDLEEICAETERASGLIKQLLAFSRRQILLLRRVDINAFLRSLANMMRLLVGENIELVIIEGDDLGLVMADPGQLEQIIINLIVNSRDASRAGGRITVETSNASMSLPSGESADVVKLEVRDNGTGMDSETQMRIFEPFFTSKERGKGTGLGLATVYGIVTQSGGTIDVQSELGKGTAISLCLPRVHGEPDALDEAAGEQEPQGGSETLLLVEDDDQVRAVSRRLLEHKGYTVLEAESGERALRLCGSHDGPIGLAVTDIIMPGMDGRELSERLPRVRPELRGVVFVSGYADQEIDTEGSESLELAFLSKPFTGPALLSTVRRLLDSER